MSKPLVQRVSIAMDAIGKRSKGWRLQVPAFFVRNGLAIHPSQVHMDQLSISHVATGRVVSTFSTIAKAERCFRGIEKLVDWSKVKVTASAEIRQAVVDVVAKCGGDRNVGL